MIKITLIEFIQTLIYIYTQNLFLKNYKTTIPI